MVKAIITPYMEKKTIFYNSTPRTHLLSLSKPKQSIDIAHRNKSQTKESMMKKPVRILPGRDLLL